MHFSVATSPHLAPQQTVGSVMRQVLLALLPGILAMTWFFGLGVLVNIAIAAVAGLLFETIMLLARGRPVKPFLNDNTAIVTAVLFALCLPPTVPWWVTVVGMLFAIVLAKQLYGGIGQNPFNPAMVGFVVVIICFPAELALWLEPVGLLAQPLDPLSTLQQIFTQPAAAVDAYSGATPLAAWDIQVNRGDSYQPWLNDTSSVFSWAVIAAAYLLGGLYLVIRRFAAWQTPAGMLLGVVVVASILWLLDSNSFLPPWTHLGIGAVMLGAFFIVTDPVSGCTTNAGRWVFGFGVGALVIILRSWSNYPDGVAFAVLLMNIAAPLIDTYCKPRVYGKRAQKRKAGAA